MTVAEGLQAHSWRVTLIKANGSTWQVSTIRCTITISPPEAA